MTSSPGLVSVIIPALNEAGNIGRLVGEVYGFSPFEVIVVDNGSTDRTAEEAGRGGAIVVAEPRHGYGYACLAGVKAAQGDILLFLDGDFSFLPAEIPDLLAPILDGRADLVLGSREKGKISPGAMPFHQRFGNRMIARLMRAMYQIALTDLGPYRAITRDLMVRLQMREMTYGWPTEMIVKSARHHARIVEVPVSYQKRLAGRSKVSGTLRGTLLASWYIFGVTLRYAWGN